jgi:hypothetical protein
VLSDPPPFLITHECAALSYARRQLNSRQFLEVVASNCVLSGVIPALSDPVEIQAEGVLGRSIANSAVPAVVVPRNPEVEVIDHDSDSTIAIVSGRPDSAKVVGTTPTNSSPTKRIVRNNLAAATDATGYRLALCWRPNLLATITDPVAALGSRIATSDGGAA